MLTSTEVVTTKIDPVIDQIKGGRIEQRLIEVASIGGTLLESTPSQPRRYAANRLALSDSDTLAREYLIKPWMEMAGMKTHDFPLAVLGIKEGTEPDLNPVVILSHTDSVPNGDMYDGVLGVIAGIEAVEAIRNSRTPHRRTIMVLALTGEESAAYNFALFGSKAMFSGLTEEELDSQKPGGLSIRETLGAEKSLQLMQPVFGLKGTLLKTPHAVLELHVEQDKKLEQSNNDLGIVEAIAAPIRYQVSVGDGLLLPDQTVHPFTKYLEFKVNGVADHSGATPMGLEHRADGLVQTAEFLTENMGFYNSSITIGDISVEGQAMNKVPGVTKTALRVAGETEKEVYWLIDLLDKQVKAANGRADLPSKYGNNPFSLTTVDNSDFKRFFQAQEILPRQMAALSLVRLVSSIATNLKDEKVVGTVGTYNTMTDGKIVLGLDLRGISKASRDDAFARIFYTSQRWNDIGINFGDRLAGSGDPVLMDKDLVKLGKKTIDELRIGTSQIMFSGAGHDIQSPVREGVPGLMIFCQSKDGIAHHPDAYTPSKNIEKGARTLAAFTLALAS